MNRSRQWQGGPGVATAGRAALLGLLALISMPVPVRADALTDGNVVALQSVAAAGLNPQRQHRVAAMVHVAVHDAVNSISPRYRPYAVRMRASADASIEAAAVQAAYGVLVRLL